MNGIRFQMLLRRHFAALGSHHLPLPFAVHINVGLDVVTLVSLPL